MKHYLCAGFIMLVAICATGASPSGVSAQSACQPIILATLTIGSQNADVLDLQRFLVNEGFLTADNQTGYFGLNTRAGVQKFQAKNNIVNSGNAATTGYGLVGVRTRSAINIEACQDAGGSAPTTPTTTTTPTTPTTPTNITDITVDVKANGSDQGLTVTSGSAVSITWTADPRTSATMFCIGSGSGVGKNGIDGLLWNGGPKTYLGLMSAHPVTTTTYTIECTDVINGSVKTATDSVVVNVGNSPSNNSNVRVDIKANSVDGPTVVPLGGDVAVTWTSSNATNCSLISPVQSGVLLNGGAVYKQGFYSGNALTVNYTITCSGPSGSATDTVIVSTSSNGLLSTVPDVCGTGAINVSWRSTNAAAYGLKRDFGATEVYYGTGLSFKDVGLTPGSSHTYYLRAYGTPVLTQDVMIAVAPNACGSNPATTTPITPTTPTAHFTSLIATPTSITLGQSSTLSWSALAGSVCSASFTSSVANIGTVNVTPTSNGSATYTMSCTKNGQAVSKSVTVSVGSAAPRQIDLIMTDTTVVIGRDVDSGYMPEVYGTGPMGRGYPGFFVSPGPAVDGFPPAANGQCLPGYAVRTGTTRTGLSAQVCRFAAVTPVSNNERLPVIPIDASWYSGRANTKFDNIDRNFYTSSYPAAFNWGSFTQAGNTSQTIGLMFRYAVAKNLVSDSPEGYGTWSYWCQNSTGLTSPKFISGPTTPSRVCLAAIAGAIDQDGRGLTWSGQNAAGVRQLPGIWYAN